MPVSRRDFLFRLACASGTLLFPFRASARPAAGRVLVAGGGFAGLRAADLLIQRGFDVRVLEAGERLGGKAFGGTVAGHPYDFGCQSFSKDMPRVQALGRRYGLTVVPRPAQAPFFLRGAEKFSGDALETLREGFDVIEDLGRSMYAELDQPARRPQLAAQTVMDWARPHLAEEAIEYFRSAFSSEWCDVPENVSMLHYLEYQRGYDDEGEEMDFRFREGLFRVAEGLARDVGSRATLRCPLEGVEASRGGPVRVRAGGRDFEADYLVLALPLLQLRRIPIRGVDTGELEASLSTVENAAVRKVLVAYDQPFWGTQARDGTFDLPCGMTVMDNSDLAAGRYTLAVFLGGPSALANPGRETVLRRLAQAFGSGALRPIGYHEQAWLGSEFLGGGYAANRAPSRDQGAGSAIPASVGKRIFLAGSEGSREFPSYAEGALYSAEVAATGIAKAHGIRATL